MPLKFNRKYAFTALLTVVTLAVFFCLSWDISFNSSLVNVIPKSQIVSRPATHKHDLTHFASKTMLIMKTGADVAQKRLPIQILTQLKRFPNFRVYSDGETRIGNVQVYDIFDKLPNELLDSQAEFGEYLMRKHSKDNHYNWDATDVHFEGDYGWVSDKYKNIPMLLDAYNNSKGSIEWFLMVDDDSYALQHSLEYLTHNLDGFSRPYYLGSWAAVNDHVSVKTKEAQESVEKGKSPWMTFAHGGSGILMSRKLVHQILEKLRRDPNLLVDLYNLPKHTCCGDVALGYMAKELAENEPIPLEKRVPDPFVGDGIYEAGAAVGDLCKPMATFHHLSPEGIQRLYDWESSLVDRKRNFRRGVLFGDYYQDFILPFVVEEREYWDNYARSESYNLRKAEEFLIDEITYNPGQSKDQCKAFCAATEKCYVWKYDEEAHICSVDTLRITIGKSVDAADGNIKRKITSGWIVNRIRELRAGSPCDSLKISRNGQYNDDELSSEGWFFRSREHSEL